MKKEIFNTFLKDNPGLEITAAADYDDNYVVICAQEKGKTDINCPYYAIDKKTYKWYSFTPMEDLDKFVDAFENRKIL